MGGKESYYSYSAEWETSQGAGQKIQKILPQQWSVVAIPGCQPEQPLYAKKRKYTTGSFGYYT